MALCLVDWLVDWFFLFVCFANFWKHPLSQGDIHMVAAPLVIHSKRSIVKRTFLWWMAHRRVAMGALLLLPMVHKPKRLIALLLPFFLYLSLSNSSSVNEVPDYWSPLPDPFPLYRPLSIIMELSLLLLFFSISLVHFCFLNKFL